MSQQQQKEQILQDMFGVTAKKVCIFGVGQVGLFLAEILEKNGIELDFFCDNNVEKQGKFFHHSVCVSLNTLLTVKEDTLVIVSPENNREILAQLKENKVPMVQTKKEVMKYLPHISGIDLHIVSHCDLNCQCCNHFSCIAEEHLVSLEVYKQDVVRLAQLAGDIIDTLKIIGGEPLLHPDLEEMMTFTRQHFPNTSILLVSNGIRLLRQGESFWRCCRENKIAITPTKYPISLDYDKIKAKADENMVAFWYFNNDAVIKTSWRVPFDQEGTQNKDTSFALCRDIRYCATVTEGKVYLCPETTNIHIFNEKFKTNLTLEKEDFLDLHSQMTLRDLIAFLNNPIPFCRYCNRGARTTDLPWKVTTGNIEEWV